MSDYIKREDALEQFDYYDLGEYLTTQIRGMLMDIPSADVAPVVRCGDCLFCQMELFEGADEPWCDIHNATVGTEMFCSWGIRKDNE